MAVRKYASLEAFKLPNNITIHCVYSEMQKPFTLILEHCFSCKNPFNKNVEAHINQKKYVRTYKEHTLS